MKRLLLAFLGLALLVTAAAAAGGKSILLVARDLDGQPLAGLRFTYAGVDSGKTNPSGAVELAVPAGHETGRQIKIFLLPGGKRGEEWFLVNPQVNIPSPSNPAEVVLMKRTAFRKMAAQARDAQVASANRQGEPTAEERKRALVAAAARQGLTEKQLGTAIASFGDTQDPKDQGIAAFLEGQYPRAETLLKGAAEKKELDLVETLQYLGASQYEQAKYHDAADSFRKAIGLRGEEAVLLAWLGRTYLELAEWSEAEPLLRRALAIDEKSFGPEHTNVAIRLNDLAALLEETNRLGEAEPLMRRALAIDEKSFGPEHTNVAIRLNNLAALLQARDRLGEAEPLMRRALAITEKSFGPEHPNVAIDLNNLAQLLQATNRLREAEPLMRRALAIAEKSLGPEHPSIAIDLNNLAQLLRATNRLGEAELLMHQALVIALDFKHRTGYEHPNQRVILNNYKQLLHAMGKSATEVEATLQTLYNPPQ